MDKDPKDPKQDPEEELKRLISELEKYQKNKQTSIAYAFLLHKNYLVHLILNLFVNILMAVTVIGLSYAVDYPLLDIEVEGLLIAIVLLTLVENAIKILLFKYFFKLMIYSLGILSWAIQVLILYGITILFEQGFNFYSLGDLIGFSIIFTIMRFILSVYIRRKVFSKTVFIGGRK